MRWTLGVVLMVGFSLGVASARLQQQPQPPKPDDPTLFTTPVKMDDQQWSRFYKRYAGQWQRNEKQSTYAGGGAPLADPKQGWLHYDAQPDGKRVLYFVGESQRKFARVHELDGRPNMRTTSPTDNTFVSRVPLDEFTMGNTLFNKSDGFVTNRHTFVFSPDGDAFLTVMMDRDVKTKKWVIGGIIHYCRPDNTACLNQ